jgi:hypothetical protein
MTRAEKNLRYYNKHRRKIHAGKFTPLCNQSGPVGEEVTCKTCLMVQKVRAIGSKVNEWERKRLEGLFRQQSAEKSAEWRRKNPDKARAACQRWREQNRDLHRIMNREWNARNREKRRAYNREYWRKRFTEPRLARQS